MQLWPSKDPDEILDYSIDWADRLAGDTIVNSQWLLESGSDLVIDDEENDTDSTTVWLSGGIADPVVGRMYLVTNRIVTAAARTMDETVRLRVITK